MQWNEFSAHIRHLARADQERVHRAFVMGEKAHHGQKRKSGEPYFTHLIAVADMLADMHADADTIIAALLHDTIEDTDLTTTEIEHAFNPTVAELIDGVTKLTRTDIGEKPNLNEQTETLRKMFTLMQKDVRIMVIKLVDRLHNMQTVEFLPPERQHALAQETQDVYVKIADRLCMQDIRNTLTGLCLAVLKPELFVQLQQLRGGGEERGQKIRDEMVRALQSDAAMRGVDVQDEEQSWEALDRLRGLKGDVATGIPSHTIVFVCADRDACYRVMGTLHAHWKRETMSFQDFINSPQINGYRGLHTTVILPNGSRIRCKIRTREMHEYAHHGVTTRCFDGAQEEFLDTLPWTQRISPLAEDTKDRSKEFWESLKSDVLGESIIIHGPANETVHLPIGATALDGAFYLFQDQALRVQILRVNGTESSFSTPLKHSDSVSVTVADQPTATREWLSWVRTGLATARIRQFLASESAWGKVEMGKQIIDQTLREHRRGFIEEFDDRDLLPVLESLGYGSLEETYRAVADGYLDPEEVEYALFAPGSATGRKRGTLRYTMDPQNVAVSENLRLLHKKHEAILREVVFHYRPNHTQAIVRLDLVATPAEQREMVQDLQHAGAEQIRIDAGRRKTMLIVLVLLVTLWGLDPVFAQMLLSTDISPFDLTFIRFLTFFGASALFYWTQSQMMPQRLKPLRLLHPSLFLSGVALFVTGLASYLTLQNITPSQYILYITVGLVALTLVRRLRDRRPPWAPIIALALLLLSILSTEYLGGGVSGIGTAMAVLSASGFAAYSVFSKRYLEEAARIRARYPAFLFWVSTVGLLLSLALLPGTHIAMLDWRDIVRAVSFSLVFAVFPYIVYFEYMRRFRGELLEITLPFVCISTFLGEFILHPQLSTLLPLPIVLLFLFEHVMTHRGQYD